jgi:hypothetical protein
MTPDAAIARVAEMEFNPRRFPSTAEMVTADMRINRVRVLVDESGRVVDAWAG